MNETKTYLFRAETDPAAAAEQAPPPQLPARADRLTRYVHEIELENWRRRQAGLAPLSYGQYTMRRMLAGEERRRI